ncbi:MAG TPA: ABC transporter permease [Verrucomicrobiae bacterium]|nr:ABC transporter permease [Verrucomicrobiae bacterium]
MNFFTELKEGLLIAWSAIRANKLRSCLTTLGIVIGIVTVTLMGTAIEGLNRAFMQSVSSIGADVLYVQRMDWIISSHEEWLRMSRRRVFTVAQAESVMRQIDIAQAVAPVAQTSRAISYKSRESDTVSVVGTSEAYLQSAGVTVAQGRFLTAAEAAGGRPVCVLGATVASNLFKADPPLGARVKLGNNSFDVVGVLEPVGGLFGGGGADSQVVVPLNQFLVAFNGNPDVSLQVKVKNNLDLDEAREELRYYTRQVRHLAPNVEDDFSINQQDQIVDTFHRVAGTIAAVGLFITGLSLFVGGIGIMNIMFVSVAERTKEIGIRKAIGANRRTILIQFLIEAAAICVLGGLIGLVIAWPATWGMSKVMPATLSAKIVALSLVVAAGTGIVSGFLPAWRAARLNPVDALRAE